MTAPAYLTAFGRRYVPEPAPQPGGVVWLRVPHDMERVDFDANALTYIPNTENPRRVGRIREVVRTRGVAMPEVYRLNPLHAIPLTAALQRLWRAINPELTDTAWWSLCKHDCAFTNNKSGWRDGDPRANFVTGDNLDRNPPAYDQPRVTGGHTFRGRLAGDRVILETIRVDLGQLPTAEQLLNTPHLWFWFTSISPSGRIQYPRRKGKDGQQHRVRVPLFTRQEVWLPAAELHLLQGGEMYLPDYIVHRG